MASGEWGGSGGPCTSVGAAMKESDTNPCLQQAYHAADSGSSHIQLSGGSGEAAASGGGLEGLDTIEVRKLPHRTRKKSYGEGNISQVS